MQGWYNCSITVNLVPLQLHALKKNGVFCHLTIGYGRVTRMHDSFNVTATNIIGWEISSTRKYIRSEKLIEVRAGRKNPGVCKVPKEDKTTTMPDWRRNSTG
jgi:hypothetical protein